ncbi:MAG TPA: DUF1761 domain-containing protein [Saprospiraceae bacterium]|nr:DUF1761 domain-containing protein [Saprospiraceae bacterium]
MMTLNWYVILSAGVIPLLVGFFWYHPRIFGNAWMKASGMTEEKGKQANMALTFGGTLILGMMLSLAMVSMTIHQTHMMSTLMNVTGFGQEGSEVDAYFKDFMSRYGTEFRSFRHGLLHGIFGGVLIALPVLAVNALFEQRSFKYIAINAGYWIVTMGLMGGVVCAFA